MSDLLLAAEDPIKERLIARLPVKLPPPHPTIHVLTASEVAQIRQQSHLTPAVWVVYQGIQPDGSPGGNSQVPGVAKIGESFAIVVSVTNADTTTDGAGARKEASRIASAVLQILLGWKPGEGLARLQLDESPEAFYEPGFMSLPLLMSTSFTLRGDPN